MYEPRWVPAGRGPSSKEAERRTTTELRGLCPEKEVAINPWQEIEGDRSTAETSPPNYKGVRDTFKQNIPKLPAGLATRACPFGSWTSNLVEWRWKENIWSQSNITMLPGTLSCGCGAGKSDDGGKGGIRWTNKRHRILLLASPSCQIRSLQFKSGNGFGCVSRFERTSGGGQNNYVNLMSLVLLLLCLWFVTNYN